MTGPAEESGDPTPGSDVAGSRAAQRSTPTPPPPPPAPPGFRWPTSLQGRASEPTPESTGSVERGEDPTASRSPTSEQEVAPNPELAPPAAVDPALMDPPAPPSTATAGDSSSIAPAAPHIPPPDRPNDEQPTSPRLPSSAAVAAVPAPAAEYHEAPISFTPLRADPPPRLFATWWLRYLLFLAQIIALAVVLLREYSAGPDDVARSQIVLAAYAVVAVLLVAWSALALIDASRLVPATRYQPRSHPLSGVALWFLAFVAPVGAVAAIRWAQERFATDPDDLGVVVATVAVVLVSFLLVWLPFRYHTRQAHRIGAPSRVVAGWFWIPLAAAVGGLAINALGLHDYLAEEGFTDWDRTVQVAVVFGLPALTFALASWRATTVFDEVIELRWLRWRTEWEQTLSAMASQPAPGPEIAPEPRRR